jgi:ankyrin repeat protein
MNGQMASNVAVTKGRLDVISQLSSAGVSLQTVNTNGDLLLHFAVASGHGHIIEMLVIECVRPSAIGMASTSPMHVSVLACASFAPSVTALVAADGDVHATTSPDVVSLHLACILGKGILVKPLLNLDADANAKDEQKVSPLHLVIYHHSVASIKHLIEGDETLWPKIIVDEARCSTRSVCATSFPKPC